MARLLRAISENGGVVFYAIDSTEIVREAERIHKTSAVTSAALGRLLTAASLMSATLKRDSDSITLRMKGDGPAGLVLAVVNGSGEVKGYIQNPIVELPLRPDGKLDVGGAIGHNGTLSVVKDLGLKEPYVGQVPLISGEVAEDITSYYATSEQIPTVCALGVLVDRDLSILHAGGYLLQLLPGASEEEITRLENNVQSMDSITHMLQQGMQLEEIMERVLDGFAPQILDEQQSFYRCDCTKERVERALISIGKLELEKMVKEDPIAQVSCQFCDKTYKIDLRQLLSNLEKKTEK
ncbi:Hsp33 family molecular chaperone HslO [uncultured Ruthenibacterium sp.]|uniref:Hsp33 family molecular chaperone HslO n=1 Tax=uncultured Ruthenibacterium sp. TaxID=1905347 RepID=UPI00349ECD72